MTSADGAAPDTTVAAERTALFAWMRRTRPDDEVSWAETHVSILVFGRERVWKLKKAVVYPFVDLSTRALRLRQCEREVQLNRRLAPDVYRGVVALDDERGAVIDHLVEMQRMPDHRRLAALVATGYDATPCLDRVAKLLARFHAAASSGVAIDASATRDAVAELWDGSIAELGPRAGTVLDQARLDRVAAMARRYLAGRSALFDERIVAGRVRDGHGDLLADDIFCLVDGPRLLDCLEFDDHLRYGDALGDVAFLAMDLERLGRADLARRFLDHYADAAADSWPASLEHLYVAYRAVVRAKVACLRALDGNGQAEDSARQLLDLAREHLESGRVRLVLIGGPPATGKTTLARAVALDLGWPVLHSDEVRKELAGIAPTTHERGALDAGIYAPEWDARTYGVLCDHARHHLEQGRSVILDASWSDPLVRDQAAHVATATSSELIAFRCAAPSEITRTRAAVRASVGTDASDAAGEIEAILGSRFAEWPGARVVDTTATADAVAATVVAALEATPDG